MLVKFEEIDFCIWHDDDDRENGECENENGASSFWGGKRVGTLSEVGLVVERMASQNACAEASYKSHLIYHSSDDGVEDYIEELEKTLSNKDNAEEFKDFIVSYHPNLENPNDIIERVLSKMDTYSKITKTFIDFLDEEELLVSYIQEIQNIGNNEFEEIINDLETNYLELDYLFVDDNILQWDSSVTRINWKAISEKFEKECIDE